MLQTIALWFWDNIEFFFGGFGVTVVLVVLRKAPSIGLRAARLIQPHLASVRTFAPREGEYNEEFYKYFKQCFDRAERDIYITGEGFDCAHERGRVLARRFADMMEDALSRGVHIIRLETGIQGHSEWAKMIAGLKTRYPNSFKLYVYKSPSGSQLSSVCVIDAHSSTRSVVEIMLSTMQHIGGRLTDLADTAIFFTGKKDLASGVRDRILKMLDDPNVVEAADEDEIVRLISGYNYYFSYGSNMLKSQMQQRIPEAEFESRGFIKGYQLAFNREGSYRPGYGVASIVQGSSEVWGAIWKIPASSMTLLDTIEDNPDAYTRNTMPVMTPSGSSILCEVYIAIPQKEHIAPEREYMDRMISGASEIGIDRAYIEKLESIETK